MAPEIKQEYKETGPYYADRGDSLFHDDRMLERYFIPCPHSIQSPNSLMPALKTLLPKNLPVKAKMPPKKRGRKTKAEQLMQHTIKEAVEGLNDHLDLRIFEVLTQECKSGLQLDRMKDAIAEITETSVRFIVQDLLTLAGLDVEEPSAPQDQEDGNNNIAPELGSIDGSQGPYIADSASTGAGHHHFDSVAPQSSLQSPRSTSWSWSPIAQIAPTIEVSDTIPMTDDNNYSPMNISSASTSPLSSLGASPESIAPRHVAPPLTFAPYGSGHAYLMKAAMGSPMTTGLCRKLSYRASLSPSGQARYDATISNTKDQSTASTQNIEAVSKNEAVRSGIKRSACMTASGQPALKLARPNPLPATVQSGWASDAFSNSAFSICGTDGPLTARVLPAPVPKPTSQTQRAVGLGHGLLSKGHNKGARVVVLDESEEDEGKAGDEDEDEDGNWRDYLWSNAYKA